VPGRVILARFFDDMIRPATEQPGRGGRLLPMGERVGEKNGASNRGRGSCRGQGGTAAPWTLAPGARGNPAPPRCKPHRGSMIGENHLLRGQLPRLLRRGGAEGGCGRSLRGRLGRGEKTFLPNGQAGGGAWPGCVRTVQVGGNPDQTGKKTAFHISDAGGHLRRGFATSVWETGARAGNPGAIPNGAAGRGGGRTLPFFYHGAGADLFRWAGTAGFQLLAWGRRFSRKPAVS